MSPLRTRPRLLTLLATGALSVGLAACASATPPPTEPVVAPPASVAATEPAATSDFSPTDVAMASAPDTDGLPRETGASGPDGPVVASPASGSPFVPDPAAPLQAVATGPYVKGRALAFMPRDCEERIYVDVAGLAGSDRSALAQLTEQLVRWAASMGAQNEVNAALATLRDAGVDPAYALHEIAACDNPDILVVGFESTKPVDPLLTGQRLLAALGENAGRIERRGAYRVLIERPGADEAAVDVQPGVLMLADRWRQGEPALAARRGLEGFGEASRSLVWIDTDDAQIVVQDKGRQLDVTIRAHMNGDPKAARGKAQQAMKEATRELGELANRVAKTPLSSLGPRLRAVRLSAEGTDMVARGSLSRTDLRELVRAIGSMGPQAIEAVVEGR